MTSTTYSVLHDTTHFGHCHAIVACTSLGLEEFTLHEAIARGPMWSRQHDSLWTTNARINKTKKERKKGRKLSNKSMDGQTPDPQKPSRRVGPALLHRANRYPKGHLTLPFVDFVLNFSSFFRPLLSPYVSQMSVHFLLLFTPILLTLSAGEGWKESHSPTIPEGSSVSLTGSEKGSVTIEDEKKTKRESEPSLPRQAHSPTDDC